MRRARAGSVGPARNASDQHTHLVESQVSLSTPHNECSITLTLVGENQALTRIVHDMCRMAIDHAIEPLRNPAIEP